MILSFPQSKIRRTDVISVSLSNKNQIDNRLVSPLALTLMRIRTKAEKVKSSVGMHPKARSVPRYFGTNSEPDLTNTNSTFNVAAITEHWLIYYLPKSYVCFLHINFISVYLISSETHFSFFLNHNHIDLTIEICFLSPRTLRNFEIDRNLILDVLHFQIVILNSSRDNQLK